MKSLKSFLTLKRHEDFSHIHSHCIIRQPKIHPQFLFYHCMSLSVDVLTGRGKMTAPLQTSSNHRLKASSMRRKEKSCKIRPEIRSGRSWAKEFDIRDFELRNGCEWRKLNSEWNSRICFSLTRQMLKSSLNRRRVKQSEKRRLNDVDTKTSVYIQCNKFVHSPNWQGLQARNY